MAEARKQAYGVGVKEHLARVSSNFLHLGYLALRISPHEEGPQIVTRLLVKLRGCQCDVSDMCLENSRFGRANPLVRRRIGI